MKGYPDTDLPIRLLVIEPSLNQAEAYVSTLRNAGLVIHPIIVTDEEQLIDQAEQTEIDLIVFSIPDATDNQDALNRLCHTAFPDIPRIAVYTQAPEDPGQLLQMMHDGARDVVAADDPEHLQLVIVREAGDLQIAQELLATRQKLQEAETRCSVLIESSRDAIAYIHEGMHMQANPAYLQRFGYVSMEDLEGLPILDMVASTDHQKIKGFLKTLGDEEAELAVTCQNSSGETFSANMEFRPATYDGEPCTQVVIRTQVQSKELERTIELLSNQDGQTGLVNRQFFMEALEERINTLREQPDECALYYIVIDGFPEVRTKVGVTESDILLEELAKIFSGQVNEEDLLARFGDHTFTILSPQAGEADRRAEQLRQVIENYIFRDINITCSIGVARYQPEVRDSQDFLNQSYSAYEAARNAGGNQVSQYAAEMAASYGEDNTGDEARINELIGFALENDRFRLVYQPIVSLQGDSRENYAVLTRLLDKNNEEILPDHFIKCAKQGEQMAAIDRWVINKAIEELAEQRGEGRKVNFFISISSAGLEDEGMLLWICDCLRKHKAKGAWITFQIRDKDLRNHIQAAKKLIDGLKKIKCLLAIDQFGSNPKAESLLKHLPVDYVKYDFDLMEDLASNQKRQDYLNELNALAKNHNAKTIAMGVEDANSLAILWTVGVNYIQGYFLQEPSENISYEFGSA